MINFGSGLRTPECEGFGKNFRDPKTVAKMHNSGSPGTKPTISVRSSDVVPAVHASSDANNTGKIYILELSLLYKIVNVVPPENKQS
jgi:hypothetical protein